MKKTDKEKSLKVQKPFGAVELTYDESSSRRENLDNFANCYNPFSIPGQHAVECIPFAQSKLKNHGFDTNGGVCRGLSLQYLFHLFNKKNNNEDPNFIAKLNKKLQKQGEIDSLENFADNFERINAFQNKFQSPALQYLEKDDRNENSNADLSYLNLVNNLFVNYSKPRNYLILGVPQHAIAIYFERDIDNKINEFRIFDPNYGEIIINRKKFAAHVSDEQFLSMISKAVYIFSRSYEGKNKDKFFTIENLNYLLEKSEKKENVKAEQLFLENYIKESKENTKLITNKNDLTLLTYIGIFLGLLAVLSAIMIGVFVPPLLPLVIVLAVLTPVIAAALPASNIAYQHYKHSSTKSFKQLDEELSRQELKAVTKEILTKNLEIKANGDNLETKVLKNPEQLVELLTNYDIAAEVKLNKVLIKGISDIKLEEKVNNAPGLQTKLKALLILDNMDISKLFSRTQSTEISLRTDADNKNKICENFFSAIDKLCKGTELEGKFVLGKYENALKGSEMRVKVIGSDETRSKTAETLSKMIELLNKELTSKETKLSKNDIKHILQGLKNMHAREFAAGSSFTPSQANIISH